ncbi:hypothetical protein FO519_004508 [Halicephalobus sp. NKZ332]|nr:hypothetical protein FO519_004508 [Halicephalobus sp. NKZ332]
MIRWLLVAVLFAVLQLSLSTRYYDNFVGESNGKNYTIVKYYEILTRLVLNVTESNGITNHFNLSNCGEWLIFTKEYSINNQGSHLYIHISGPVNDDSLVIVDLTALSNNISNGKCIPIADSYFGKYKIYIYRVENSTILKRWLVADGELTKPIKVVETEFPIRRVDVYNNMISIDTTISSMNNYWKIYDYKDAPKCDVPEDDTTCEDQALEETLKRFPIPEEYFVGERNGKSYTITKYKGIPRLILSIDESNGITNHFNLSTCDEPRILIKKYSINNQGSHLYIHIWGTENDDSLVIVDLTALSNNISNGNCISIDGSYLGEYKTYIYRIENTNILKRWLLAPDGELTKSIEILETDFPIEYVNVDDNIINIGIMIPNMDEYGEKYISKDAPKCDVPENDTTCEEDQALKETPKRIFIPEEKSVGERNGKSYTITGYKGTPRLILSINEPNRITNHFNLSNCGESWIFMKKYSINNQGSHLYIHIWGTENDDSLVIVDLTALSNNISNGTCISIADSYLGIYKTYIYRVENSTILKRWLVADGELTKSVEVAKTKLISTGKEDSGPFSIENYHDLPRCDVSEDDTTCKEDQALEKTPNVIPSSYEYFVGERNDKNYTVIKYSEIPTRLVLNVTESNGITNHFNLSNCGEWLISIEKYSINNQGSHLYIHISGPVNDDSLVIVDLTALSNNISNGTCISIADSYLGIYKTYIYRVENSTILKRCNGTCISIADSYLGIYKTYIYRVENSTILKRWLVAPDGELTKPIEIVKTEFPIRRVAVHDNMIRIHTMISNMNNYLKIYDYKDAPKCDVPEDDTTCEEDQALVKTPNVTPSGYEYFIGESNGKNYTIIKYKGTTHRLVLSINESNRITNHFNLSTCGESWILMKKYSINNQGSHLYIHIRGTENDDSLISVNLMALANDSSNGKCIPIADSYLGKYKTYIYRVEKSTILKRWLVAPDGELTNSFVVTKTRLVCYVLIKIVNVRFSPSDMLSLIGKELR